MTRRYETMFIIKPTLTDEERAEKINLIRDTLTKQGAEIQAESDMGTRDLAYKIEKFERGYYVVFYFTAESGAIKELERVYGITEDVIRFIVIKYEKQVEIKAWENMVKKAKGEKVEEKRLSYGAPRGDRKPRQFNRDNRGERGDRRPPREDKREEKKEETKTESSEG